MKPILCCKTPPPPPRKYSKKYSRILEYILGICRKIRVSTSILKNGTRVPKYSSTEILGRITDASTVYNCNLVEMPITVSNLLVAGEVRIFNFVENMNPLYLEKRWKIVFLSLFNSALFLKFEKVWTRNQFFSLRRKFSERD